LSDEKYCGHVKAIGVYVAAPADALLLLICPAYLQPQTGDK
jgi:hypothetical protein